MADSQMEHRFLIQHQLHQGHRARTYLCTKHSQPSEQYAIQLTPKKRVRNADELKRFWQQIAMQNSLRHPGVLQICSQFETPDDFCVVTSLCSQGSLEKILEKRQSLLEVEVQCIGL